ncbi:MAG: DUF2752 domain-containing protein [Prevotellaceae bacterium]|nr:DUF2752 domain-containing protein [Prevotellaceae bacterium]
MSRADKIVPYALPLLLVAMCLLYAFVDPVRVRFALPCPWKLLTGMSCPACGFQRALHALLHGHFAEAIGYNYFFIFSIPYAALAVVAAWYNFGHAFDRLRAFIFHRRTLHVYILLYCAWWVLRNIFGI